MFREASDGGLSHQKRRPNICTRGPVRSVLSYQSKRELVQQIAPRYQEASRAHKILMLDEFVAITSYARKYVIQLLNHPGEPKPRSQQARLPHYGPEVQQALLLAWKPEVPDCQLNEPPGKIFGGAMHDRAGDHVTAHHLAQKAKLTIPDNRDGRGNAGKEHRHIHISEWCVIGVKENISFYDKYY